MQGRRRERRAANWEIEALTELLALLALEGRIVTADAMHCQPCGAVGTPHPTGATAQSIMERGGDYCLALKGNQPALFDDVRLWLDDSAIAVEHAETVDGDHGRIEARRAVVAQDVAWLAERHDFPGLAAVAKVTAAREIDGKSTTASRYYLLSTPLGAARLAEPCASRSSNPRSSWPSAAPIPTKPLSSPWLNGLLLQGPEQRGAEAAGNRRHELFRYGRTVNRRTLRRV